jgi:lipoate-protein ligase B
LLLLEHPNVYTFGRKGSADNLLWDEAECRRRGVDIVWCDRGGDVTYHGPGQLVGYPILGLQNHGDDVVAYLRKLEDSLIAYLQTIEIPGTTVPGMTGVWSQGRGLAHRADPAKVAAIGIKFSRSVVSHGFALNLSTDLDYFAGIVPCGLAGKEAASVASLGGPVINTQSAALSYSLAFRETFTVDTIWRDAADLPWGVAPRLPIDTGHQLRVI